MTVYAENPKESINKIPATNVSRYKINIQKSIAFLYISNEQLKFEIKNSNIYISTGEIKNLGINKI